MTVTEASTPALPHEPQPDPAVPEPARNWVTPALLGLLLATALLYLINLGANGWANSFYAAAAQAGSQSWKAWFFGSFDSANFITVDKPPASLWLSGLSARIFGVNPWSILVPEALCGVAAVGLLFATVRRWAGPVAGLIAGAVLALTPVAVLMFRFNNPDALLVLLLVAGAYGVTRAVEKGQTRWLVLAGTAVGFAFLTKMLQAFLVLPAFGLAYLWAAPVSVAKRLWQLALAGVAVVVSAGWWVLAVELWPASSRPYVGGSQNNSVLELALGYNGLGRITGDETGSVGGGGAGGAGSRWGETGLLRLFDASYGGQASWLIPAALLALVAGLWLTRRAPRTDQRRAGFVLWGGWLLVTGLTFSLMQGIIHQYYTVALAPAIGALIGAGAVLAWRSPLFLPLGLALTSWWAFVLLGRTPDFLPGLRWLILLGGLAVACALLLIRLLPAWATRTAAVAAATVALAGPLAFSLQTAASAKTGAIPTAGPQTGMGFGGGGPSGNGRIGPDGGTAQGGFGRRGGIGLPGTANGTTGTGSGGAGLPGGTGLPGGNGMGGTGMPGGGTGAAGGGMPGGGMGNGGGGMRGGMGGLLNATAPSAELLAALKADAGKYTWIAAAVGANNAAGYQLAADAPVMAIGGFNGSDPAPSLAEFQQLVRQGEIHYFIGGGGFRASSGSSVSQQIAAWVTANFTATTIGGTTVYDLSQGAS